MKKTITEGKSQIRAYTADVVSKEMPVFYNPVMKFNRDTAVFLLNAIDKKGMQISDPMAGSGVRAVRLMTELKKAKIKSISINDLSKESVKIIKENISLNRKNIKTKEITITNKDANIFLLESSGFDYIDIDPFGTPNPFLESAIKRIAREGILAVTATDTAPLSGTYPSTCKRKYWATPIRNEHMHEIGLRILIRKIQLIGAQYEKALTPVFSYSKDHYFRTYLSCEKSKTKADEILKSHQYFHYCTKCMNHFVSKKNEENCCKKAMDAAGPIFIGKISDDKLAAKIISENPGSENINFLCILKEESGLDNVGFTDLHVLSRKYGISPPKTDKLLSVLKEKGFFASRTHFNEHAIKTDAKIEEIIKYLT